jgi:hypothetical protein
LYNDLIAKYLLSKKSLFYFSALTAQNNDDLMTSVGSVGHVPANEKKIEDFSLNGTNLGSLPKFSVLNSDKNYKNSTLSLGTLGNSFSELEVDTDSLPKPTMPKRNEDDLKMYRKKSCENSFDEDLDEVKSLPDSTTSENESKA